MMIPTPQVVHTLNFMLDSLCLSSFIGAEIQNWRREASQFFSDSKTFQGVGEENATTNPPGWGRGWTT